MKNSKRVICVSVVCLIGIYFSFMPLVVLAENWVRSTNVIYEKEWNNSKPLIFGQLIDPPANNNNCSADESGPDKALSFDISILHRLAGRSFDVNNIYIDGIASGEYALNLLQLEFLRHGYNWAIPYLLSNNWMSNGEKVYICVGSFAQIIGRSGPLESIILWYDGSVQTNYHSSPRNGENDSSDYSGSKVDMRTVKGSLKVSNTGQKPEDIPGPGYQSTPDPQETESPNLPDFIVKKVILKNGQGNLFLAFYNNHRKLRIETIFSKTSEKPIGRETNITCT